jgi:hypothetical protein
VLFQSSIHTIIVSNGVYGPFGAVASAHREGPSRRALRQEGAMSTGIRSFPGSESSKPPRTPLKWQAIAAGRGSVQGSLNAAKAEPDHLLAF